MFQSADPDAPVGARVAVTPERNVAEVDASLRSAVVRGVLENEARTSLAGTAVVREVAFGGVRALIEVITPPPHLFVIGTRHDAVPMVTLAKAVGWGVTVADAFASISAREKLKMADHFAVGDAATIAKLVDGRARPLVALMTHDYERDRSFLRPLLETHARYVGVLGSRARTQRMLSEAAVPMNDDIRARLHAPMGLDLGAETPSEIALAALAEMQATLMRASAARLREGYGAIHESRAPLLLRDAEAAE